MFPWQLVDFFFIKYVIIFQLKFISNNENAAFMFFSVNYKTMLQTKDKSPYTPSDAHKTLVVLTWLIFLLHITGNIQYIYKRRE